MFDAVREDIFPRQIFFEGHILLKVYVFGFQFQLKGGLNKIEQERKQEVE